MKKDEQNEGESKNVIHPLVGWQCPVCGRVMSPYITVCPGAHAIIKTGDTTKPIYPSPYMPKPNGTGDFQDVHPWVITCDKSAFDNVMYFKV